MRSFYLVVFVLGTYFLKAQTIINAYARVTAISGSNVLSLSNVNQSNHTFNVGEKIIIMQMQDDVIGTNTTNISSFGDLATIGNAGLFEIGVVAAISPTSGAPGTLTLSTLLTNGYNTGPNSAVQIITFRNLGANYTTTANITALAWDGNTGGVLALEVNNTLTLNHKILANGLGFAGGSFSSSADEACDNSVYITSSNLKAFKGTGIYKSTNVNFTNGRGKILNGGGGGSQNNSGGGGGGNYTSGGTGGLGWQCTSGNSGYGLGGISLSSVISNNRIFMGGGGGGGQQNNNVGTSGGSGGGIIFMKASTIATSTLCGSPVLISANGTIPSNSGNDGAGGGGAGGSIIIQANSFAITAACSLTVSANGGNGGSVTDSGTHGGGAGGGQGYIVYAIMQPTVNITSQTLNGNGGASNSGGSAFAAGGSGSNNSGIAGGATGILPIELISFNGSPENNSVKLNWTTATEKDNDYFTVEKSENGIYYSEIGKVKGAGTSLALKRYGLNDNQPYEGISYYRLKQTDFSGGYRYSGVISVNIESQPDFLIYPNPVDKEQGVTISLDKTSKGKELDLYINDLSGKEIYHTSIQSEDLTQYTITFKDMAIEKGIYLLKIKSAYLFSVKKLLVQ